MEHTHTHTTQQTPKIWIILCLFILYVGRLVPCSYYSLFITITSPTGAGSFSLRLTNSFWKYHKIVKWQKYQTVWQSFEIELKRMTTRGRRNENRKKIIENCFLNSFLNWKESSSFFVVFGWVAIKVAFNKDNFFSKIAYIHILMVRSAFSTFFGINKFKNTWDIIYRYNKIFRIYDPKRSHQKTESRAKIYDHFCCNKNGFDWPTIAIKITAKRTQGARTRKFRI